MATDEETFAPFGRFVEPAFLILMSLSNTPKHGYAMMDDIAHISGTKLGAGTLYAAIARLEQHGLIAAIPATDRRRPYQLTDQGRALLHAHLIGLQQLAMLGFQRLEPA
jgi:DNA-binding PadR family transcriptional regulator